MYMEENEDEEMVDQLDLMFQDDDDDDEQDDPTGEVDGQEEEGQQGEEDSQSDEFDNFLKELSKEVKYMDKEVKIESKEDLIKTYQKGLDYERQVSKLEEVKNSDEMKYLEEKAKENNMTTKDFIKALKEQEEKAEAEAEAEKLEEMILSGVPEETAKEVIETTRARKEFEREKARLEADRKAKETEEQKSKDLQDFLRDFPDLKVEDIPKEVLVKSDEVGLKNAYVEHLYNVQKEKLEQLEKQVENKQSSPNTNVVEGVKQESKDPFLEGFDSED